MTGTCGTCKHWDKTSVYEMDQTSAWYERHAPGDSEHVCLRVHYDQSGPARLGSDEYLIPTMFLLTGPEFGCVLHETETTGNVYGATLEFIPDEHLEETQ